MQQFLADANQATPLTHLPRGPFTARIHTAAINDGQGYVHFLRNPGGYFYVESFSPNGQTVLNTGLLFDMEKCAAHTENLQAVDPDQHRYTDAVSIDGCVFSRFALHGESPEALKQALSKVWVVEGRTA